MVRRVQSVRSLISLTNRQCQNLEDCSARSKDRKAKPSDDEARYVSRYLEREYIVL
jgi:hypothetical protein